MLYKPDAPIDSISLLIHFTWTSIVIMASNQVDTSDEVDFSVFRVELPRLNPYAQDVYGCLLNNGMYVFQPNCKMDLRVVNAALGCYYQTVRLVYIQSPQVAYVDICIGKELTSPGFQQYFFTGIHRATFPENPVLDCNVVFSPLSESVQSDQVYSMAVAIADQKELPGMNLQNFHRNLGWNYLARPKLLDLPSEDELDLIGQKL